MFAYCNNNPVNSSDSLGSRPVSILERFGDTSIPVPPKKEQESARKEDRSFLEFCDEQYQRYVESQIQNAQLELQGAITIGKATVDWISDPQNVANALHTASLLFDGGAAYLGGISVGLALPSGGLSAASAGVLAGGFVICAFVLEQTSKVIAPED